MAAVTRYPLYCFAVVFRQSERGLTAHAIVAQPFEENPVTHSIAKILRIGFDNGEMENTISPRPLKGTSDQHDHLSRQRRSRRHQWLKGIIALLLSMVLASFPLFAQIIETVAGSGVRDGGAATDAPISPSGVAVDSSGNLYIVDIDRIRKVTVATGVITTIAGIGTLGYNGNNIAAISAALASPNSVAVDSSGNLYIADTSNHLIRKVARDTGVITTIAGVVNAVRGTGEQGYNGDNIVATSATLSSPSGIVVDASGDLYFADSGNFRIRKLAVATGIITSVAGNGSSAYNGDNIAATAAGLYSPSGVAVDSSGNLYITESFNHRIRKVTSVTGLISTVAGTGMAGYNGDGILATNATLNSPSSVAVDAVGNLYIVDRFNHRIRKVTSATGVISTVAGNSFGYNGDNIVATSANLKFPSGVAFDASGNLYIADSFNNRVRKVTLATGLISTVAGIGVATYSGDGGAATSATLFNPSSLAITSSGDLLIADGGDVVIADRGNNRIRQVKSSTGIITTVVGIGTTGFSGDGGAATSAALFGPTGVAVDSFGNIYIADRRNHRIRKVAAATGTITTLAGTGTQGFSGDGGAASVAMLNEPNGVAVDSSDNLYIMDHGNLRIRKVTIATGIVSTIVGPPATCDATGFGIAFCSPNGIAVDLSGNLYFADSGFNRIRKVTVALGLITTVAGTGLQGYNGDNIAAVNATLSSPLGVAVDSSGNLYISDSKNARIRKVMADTGIITTLAGNGTLGYSGDGAPTGSAQLNNPTGIAVDASGIVYFADSGNARVRKVSAAQSANYEGLWWNSPAGSESGWGINFAHQGNVIFATWFTYDATGKALWLSMTANRIGSDFIGTLYQTSGPAFFAVPFDPTSVTRTAVGSGTLSFSDTNNARFTYIVNGTAQTKSIVRQVFGPLPACTFGAQPNLTLATNYQDLWWAAPGGVESGWGVNFTHQGDNIFVTWFTYDGDGTPLWLSATAAKVGAGVYAGPLYRTTGPAFNAVPFSPTAIGRTVVGTLTLAFADGNSGTFTYTAFGAVQSKSITRQVFNVPGTVCQ